MALTKGELGESVVAINDVTYAWAPEFGDQGLTELNEDLSITEQSQSEEMSENKADGSRWRSQRSYHGGEGQQRFDSPSSNPAAFMESKDVDVFTTPGQLTMLHSTSTAIALTNEYPNAPQKLVATDEHIFVAVGKPQVNRFAALDASDAVGLDYMATETPTVEVYDLATDGSLCYVALAASGTHRNSVGTTTQLDSHDSDTNWTASTGTLSDDTTTKQEGTGSLKWSTTAGGVGNATNTRTIGATDYSDVTAFKLWYKATDPGDEGTTMNLRLRMQTSAGNYYEATIATNVDDDTWREVTLVTATDFAATGAPNWASIADIVYVSTRAGVAGCDWDVWVDDLRKYVPTAFSHYSDADARVLGWGKDRLFAMGLKSGTTHRFFEVGSTTTSVERDELPDGYVGTDICEIGGHVYYSYYRGPRSIISSWDGTTPEIAVQMPLGETVLSMAALANGNLLIGARRIGSVSATSGRGVLYVGKPDGQGQLSLTRIAIFGADDGVDYGIRMVSAYGDFGYFTYTASDEATMGMGIYDPSTGGYARFLSNGTTVRGIDGHAVFKGRHYYTRSGAGIIREDATYATTGTLTSSIIDWNMDKAKMLLQAEAGFLPLTTGQQVAIAYSTDNGVSYTTASTASTVGDEVATGNIRSAAKQAQYKLTLTSGASATTTPTVKKAGISAIYGFKPRSIIRAYLKASEGRNKAGVPSAAKTLDTIRSNLKTLRAAQTIVDVQLPEWASSADTLKCVVSQAHVVRKPLPSGQLAKYIFVELKEVPG